MSLNKSLYREVPKIMSATITHTSSISSTCFLSLQSKAENYRDDIGSQTSKEGTSFKFGRSWKKKDNQIFPGSRSGVTNEELFQN